MRVFLRPDDVRVRAGSLHTCATQALEISRWARTTPLPELPPHLRAETETVLRGRAGASVEHAATVWDEAARELVGRAALAERQEGMNPRAPAWLTDGLSLSGRFFRRLGSEARGRPMKLSRALLRGSLAQRIRNVGKYIEKVQVRAVHRAYNAAWRTLGMQRLKPAWTKVTKPVSRVVGGVLGKVARFAQPAFDAYGQIRKGNYGGAAATLGAAVLTKNPIATVADMVTGGSVSGYARVALETPGLLFSGEQGAAEMTKRIEDGDYGVLPQWQAKYISEPLSGFIYDKFVK